MPRAIQYEDKKVVYQCIDIIFNEIRCDSEYCREIMKYGDGLWFTHFPFPI